MVLCTFCGQEKKLKDCIEGQSGSICRSCLEIVTEMAEETAVTDSVAKSDWTPLELKAKIDEIVIGQEEAKKQLIMEFHKRYHLNMPRSNVFFLGNSGVGKTFLVRTLAKLIQAPFYEFDATTFSETGYKGRDVEGIIEEIAMQAEGDLDKIEKAIVFIDEIDKVLTTTNRDGVNKVQHSLLKLIEGSTYTVDISRKQRVTIDTSKIQFIVAGACIGIDAIKKERITPSRGIGFSQQPPTVLTNESPKITAKDLIKFGFIPEFVGRFPIIVQLKDLEESDYREILLKSKQSVIPSYTELFQGNDIELVIPEETIAWLIQKTKEDGLGVRGVQNTLIQRFNTLMYDSFGDKPKKIVLNELEQKNY